MSYEEYEILLIFLYLSLSRGILITSESTKTETCIQLGDFILVEGVNADQPYVAQLLDLYEDGKRMKNLYSVCEKF